MTLHDYVLGYISQRPDYTFPSYVRLVNEEYTYTKIGMLYVKRSLPEGVIPRVTNISDNFTTSEKIIVPLYAFKNNVVEVKSSITASYYIFKNYTHSIYTIKDTKGNKYYCGNGMLIDSDCNLCFRIHKKYLSATIILNTIKVSPNVLYSTNAIEKNCIPKIIKEALQCASERIRVKVEIGEDNPNDIKLYSPQSIPPIISNEEINAFFAHNALTL